MKWNFWFWLRLKKAYAHYGNGIGQVGRPSDAWEKMRKAAIEASFNARSNCWINKPQPEGFFIEKAD